MTDAEKPQGIFAPGSEFFVGCNYWASHAGTAMWRDWRPEVVEADFRLLAENGVEVARVFPLWPDFQPIQALTGGGPRRSPRPTAGPARHRKLLCNRWFLSPAAPGRR